MRPVTAIYMLSKVLGNNFFWSYAATGHVSNNIYKKKKKKK